MKIVLSKTALHHALVVCGRALSKTVVIPILDCYLFDIDGSCLTISACNNSLSISHRITIDNNRLREKFAISSGVLKNLIGQMTEQPLAFVFDNNIVTIHSDAGTYTLPYEDGYLMPEIKNDPKHTFKINGDVLSKAIDRAIFAIMDDKEAALSSLYMEIETNKVTITASNHHVLSTFSYPAVSDIKTSVTIPKQSATAILNLKADTSVIISKNSIGFYEADTSVIMVLSNHIFPDYRAVIGCSNDKFINVDRIFLRSAINRAKVFSNQQNWRLKLELNGKLTITGEDEDFKQCAKEVIDIEYEGEPLIIGCSGTLMSEALGKMNCDDVNIAFYSATRAIIMRESRVEKETPENLMLIMPMMLL